MNKSIIGKIIKIFLICTCTIEIGIFIGYYMLANIDFNKYKTEYNVEVIK